MIQFAHPPIAGLREIESFISKAMLNFLKWLQMLPGLSSRQPGTFFARLLINPPFYHISVQILSCAFFLLYVKNLPCEGQTRPVYQILGTGFLVTLFPGLSG